MRDALSLFDQVLAFTGDEVHDDDVAGLLGLVDRELLHRASKAIVEGDSLGHARARREPRRLRGRLPQLRARAAPAPARDPAREARPRRRARSSPPILPEELERLRALAGALSEEDLLRGLDLLTRAEGELRSASDPRVALDLVLLKLVQMRRLVPFAELVARVERLLAAARRRAAAPRAAPAAPRARARAAPAPRRARPRAARAPDAPRRAGARRRAARRARAAAEPVGRRRLGRGRCSPR